VAALDFRTRLLRRASRAGLYIPESLADALVRYYELLSRWNRKINLTALTDPDAAVDRLLLEPVAAARYLADRTRIIDVGSGSGSPAIPLVLVLGPACRVTMVEVKARKAAFLREALRELDLPGSTVETARFEELLSRPDLHEAFDVASLRAVRIEQKTLRTVQAFLRPGGLAVLFRGGTGPERPETLMPPLEFVRTVPLIETNQSRLTILVKQEVGVSRGTSGGAGG
jgi:16S rRNA (guanine527-N7)-methyltransferase